MIKRSWRDAIVLAGFVGLLLTQRLAAGDVPPATQPGARSESSPATTAPASQPGAADIEALVAQLSSSDWKQRRAAQEKLTGLGAAAEEALRELAKHESLDPEARKGIETVLARIVADQKLLRTLVTIKQTAKPTEIYASLGKQANMQFAAGTDRMLNGLEQQAIDVDIDKASFWQALLQLDKQCGLYIQDLDANGAVELRPVAAGLATTPTVTAGPILTTINRIEIDAGRAIDFGGLHPMNARRQANNEATYKFFFFSWCEPKLKPLTWSIDSIDECLTDTGETLKPQFRGMRASGQINKRNDTQLTLAGSHGKATVIRKLRMTATYNLELERQTLEIPNILAVHNGTYDVGGFRMIINGVNKMADDRYGYELSIYRDGKTPAEWSQIQEVSMRSGYKFLDENGNELSFSGGGSQSGPNEVSMNGVMMCNARNGLKVGPPSKFVWSIASKVQHLTIPLSFTDIPLP